MPNLKGSGLEGSSTSILGVWSLLLLALPNSKTARELQSFIYEEDYAYFLRKFKSVRQEELTEMLYQMTQISTILNFGVI